MRPKCASTGKMTSGPEDLKVGDLLIAHLTLINILV